MKIDEFHKLTPAASYGQVHLNHVKFDSSEWNYECIYDK